MHYLFYLWAITWRSHKQTGKHRNPVEPKSLLSPEQGRQEPVWSDATLQAWLMVCYILNLTCWMEMFPILYPLSFKYFAFKNVLLFSFDLWVCALLIFHIILVKDLIFFSQRETKWNCVKSEEKIRVLTDFRFDSSFWSMLMELGGGCWQPYLQLKRRCLSNLERWVSFISQ